MNSRPAVLSVSAPLKTDASPSSPQSAGSALIRKAAVHYLASRFVQRIFRRVSATTLGARDKLDSLFVLRQDHPRFALPAKDQVLSHGRAKSGFLTLIRRSRAALVRPVQVRITGSHLDARHELGTVANQRGWDWTRNNRCSSADLRRHSRTRPSTLSRG